MIVIGLAALTPVAGAQELGGAGTIQGVVKDPTGGIMQAVEVRLTNPVSGFSRATTTDAGGRYVFRNLPPNRYHLEVSAEGFQRLDRDIDVRTAVPIEVNLNMTLAVATTAVEVVGHVEDLLERDPSAHTDIDQSLVEKLPIETVGGLNQVITMASPGVVADSNGFFHPVGDHAQTQFSIDNQPVTDQQSRIYSNQISSDAVQSMEVITGVAPAEYGDKSSLVVHIVTKSGLDQARPTGNMSVGYGSFKAPLFEANIGAGSHTVGNFLSITGTRTDRFLDPPELQALHDTGDSQSVFDRIDAKPGDADTLHVNLHLGRSSFAVPNTIDAESVGQDQHQKIVTFNIAPGYTRIIGAKTLFSANGFVRQDHVTYTPSANPFADLPASVSQDRTLRNLGVKADVAYASGNHNFKFGGSITSTKLKENLTLGITDPTDPAFEDSNGNFDPRFAPFVLGAPGGAPFAFNQEATINQQAAYAQDDIKAGNATFKLGLRLDHYDGLTSDTLLQPRLGVSYAVAQTATVLRASYGRTLETPYHENLLLSSGVAAEHLVGEAVPLAPGRRNQFEAGAQQSIGRWVVVDFGYFKKKTDNAYDFGVLFDTPIVFPISWDHSNLDGFTGRVNLVEHKGFSAFVVMAHTNAIFSGPGNGGLFIEPETGEFRIDHDQKFNSTTNVQYVFEKRTGAWAALSWRYDSGLVVSSIGDVLDLLTLTPAQQAAAGVTCGGVAATPDSGFTACTPGQLASTRLSVPPAGTGDPLNNPARVAPRHLLDLGVGVDNLFQGDKTKVRARFSIINLTNEDALYNFLSTFTGTHFVTPRAYQLQVGVTF